jgi:predicted short-subunit dehydrogenase-like oxidoreductase (DUF2520 family)
LSESSRDVVDTCAIVGPGRAGGAIAIALVGHGWRVVRIAGRSATDASVRSMAERFGAVACDVADAGIGASLVVIATPDAAVPDAAAAVAPGLGPGSLVIHLSGAGGLRALDAISRARPDVVVGALHPLQTIPSPDAGAARLPGSWAAVAGPEAVTELAAQLGLHPFPVDDDARGAYHAAAAMASNHLVALLGQVERVAATAGVPLAAFEPLVRATVDNAFALGPARALTGPVARGDVETILRHLASVDADEQRAYRALAEAAARLAGPAADPVRTALT